MQNDSGSNDFNKKLAVDRYKNNYYKERSGRALKEDEVFIFADSKQEADQINQFNSDSVRCLKRKREQQISNRGRVAWHEFNDVSIEIHNRLFDSFEYHAAKAVPTVLIGILQIIEEEYGYLWGKDNPSGMITQEQKEQYYKWKDIRKRILDHGFSNMNLMKDFIRRDLNG